MGLLLLGLDEVLLELLDLFCARHRVIHIALEVIAECRPVIDAVLREVGYEDRGRLLRDGLKRAGLPSEIVDAVAGFRNLLHTEHHPGHHHWRRADARFAFVAAAALAEYLGNLDPNPKQ